MCRGDHSCFVFPASVGLVPAAPQLVRYPPYHPPFRLPSALCRRGHNWSATGIPSAFPASVGLVPAEPQLVRYRLPSAFPASVGLVPAEPQLVRYRAYHPPFRLPSALCRRRHNWSATRKPSALPASVGLVPAAPQLVRYRLPSVFPASVGLVPAEPQLVRYPHTIRFSGFGRPCAGGATTGPLPHTIRLSGFRRPCAGGATTGPLPSHHDTPSVESTTCHHTGTPARPNQAAACFGVDGDAPCCAAWTAGPPWWRFFAAGR